MFAASLFLAWAVSMGLLPGLDALSRLESFDFAWLFSHPLLFDLAIATTLVVVGALAFWIAGHVADFRERFAQAFRVMSPPRRYFGRVAVWQAADWGLRLLTIWFMLAAFGIPQTVQNAGLVQVSTSVSTLFPITPAGVGTEQAFLLYVLHGVATASVLLAFSVGAKLTITVTNVVAGFTAIALTLRTVRFRKALGPPPSTARPSRPESAFRRSRSRVLVGLGRPGLVELRVEVARRLLRQARERPRAPPATPRGTARRSRSAG